MSKNQHLGFIGAGNMATALIKGLIESGVYDREHLLAADKDEDALKKVSGSFGVKCYSSNLKVTSESSIVVLSVKPQNMREALEEMKGAIGDHHLIISIAAGIPLRMIREISGQEIPLIRVMPNTPALVQKGVSALAAGSLATAEHMAKAKEIFGAVGDTVVVEDPTRGNWCFSCNPRRREPTVFLVSLRYGKDLGFRNEEGYGYENALFSGLKALY